MEGKHNIIIVGPAYPYRGGISAFNERLAREFVSEGHTVELVTFTLQYPSFLFPGKTQYSEDPAPEGLRIVRKINSINPLSWISAARYIRKKKADLTVVAFWMPYMAPALGTIARLSKTFAVGLVHNLIPHEHKPGDKLFARYFCSSMDRFVTLSEAVSSQVRTFAGRKGVECTPHPLYDNFGEKVSRGEACKHLNLDSSDKILLSFGLIREYKGLDWLLEAYASIPDRSGVKLVVAGEFYSNGEKYHQLAQRLGVDDEILWRTEFIPDSEVKYYFCAADLIVQPYKSATQSGVTQIAYHFEKPVLVTRVGGLAEIIPDGKVGYVVEPDPVSVSSAIVDYLSKEPDFSEGIVAEKKKYSWLQLTEVIVSSR